MCLAPPSRCTHMEVPVPYSNLFTHPYLINLSSSLFVCVCRVQELSLRRTSGWMLPTSEEREGGVKAGSPAVLAARPMALPNLVRSG